MTAAWVAAGVRGRQLLRRAGGAAAAPAVVAARSWDEALEVLGRSADADRLPAAATRPEARQAVLETLAWRLRVLAGWLPPGGIGLIRAAAAPIEIGNIERRLAELDGTTPAIHPIDLGALSVVSHRLDSIDSPPELRELLARSVWGDPGGDDAPTVALGLRVAWARRVRQGPPIGRPWARVGAAVLLAREELGFHRPIAPMTARDLDELLGRCRRRAGDGTDPVARLRACLREDGDVFDGVASPADLWRAEAALVGRIDRDAAAAVSGRRAGPDLVAAVLAAMLVDTWRLLAAIDGATRGVRGTEVLDALAC